MRLPFLRCQVSSIKYQEARRGFTLIELLVVLAIIAILMSVGLASFRRAQQNTRDGQRRSDVENIRGALEQYYSDHNVYPPTASYTNELTGASGGNRYLRALPLDPLTDGQYVYIGGGQTYCLGAVMEIPSNFNTTPCGAANWGITQSD